MSFLNNDASVMFLRALQDLRPIPHLHCISNTHLNSCLDRLRGICLSYKQCLAIGSILLLLATQIRYVVSLTHLHSSHPASCKLPCHLIESILNRLSTEIPGEALVCINNQSCSSISLSLLVTVFLSGAHSNPLTHTSGVG